MPVASQASSQPHRSLRTSFGSLFQAFHHNPSAVAPDPAPLPAFAPPSSSPAHHDPYLLKLYQTFESNLTQRLSSLSPMDDDSLSCVDMASLKQFLQVLLATQADLMELIPPLEPPLSPCQSRMMEDFLERSIKLLDVCRVIKEQIADVERAQGILQLIVSCLSSKNGDMLNMAQVARARKALAELLANAESEKYEYVPPVNEYRSFKSGDGGKQPEYQPQRWRSWHGTPRSSPSPATLQAPRQLQALGSVFVAPKPSPGDVEEYLCAAMYAMNVVSIFFLGILTAALPSINKTYVPTLTHPRLFPWAAPLAHLQGRVQEELKWRGKKTDFFAGMSELDQIATIAKRLFELTEAEDGLLGDKAKEEIKNLVKQLGQYVEELYRDLGPLCEQLMSFYSRVISSRNKIMDVFSMA